MWLEKPIDFVRGMGNCECGHRLLIRSKENPGRYVHVESAKRGESYAQSIHTEAALREAASRSPMKIGRVVGLRGYCSWNRRMVRQADHVTSMGLLGPSSSAMKISIIWTESRFASVGFEENL